MSLSLDFAREKSVIKAGHTKSAFSLIELVCVIAILGVLVVAIPSFLHTKEKSCYAKLAQSLATLQERFSLLYTSFTLSPTPLATMQESSLQLLQTSLQNSDFGNTKNCQLTFSKNRLIATAGNQNTIFSITPSDFSEQPAFKCNFTTNALCRKILERTKIR